MFESGSQGLMSECCVNGVYDGFLNDNNAFNDILDTVLALDRE